MPQEWIYAYASAIGNSHVAEQIPCQDHCRVEHYERFSLAVVCDGAGSCTNSHIGAKGVSEFALFHFQQKVKAFGWDISEEAPKSELWHEVAKAALREIKNDLENLSINLCLEFKSLACTVIVAVILPKALLLTHIGDGRAGYCNILEEWFPFMTPFRGKEANETVFITSDIWEETLLDTFVESRIITEQVKAFCLLTDGCEKASFECNLYDEEKETYYDPNKPYKAFFHQNVTQHLPMLRTLGKPQEEINFLWKQFLSTGNDKLRTEPDDKTMILAVNLASVNSLPHAETGTP